MKALVIYFVDFMQYVMFSSLGLSLLYFISHLTTQWSDYKQAWDASQHLNIGCQFCERLDQWCYPDSVSQNPPTAVGLMLPWWSMKIFMSTSVSILLVCILKSPSNRMLPSVVSWSVINM